MPHLFRPSLIVLAAMCMAGAAQAQNGPISTGAVGQVFFSPSGQPFRAASGQPYPVATWFAQADADKDGKISHAEFDADANTFFTRLDTNRDGYINSPENTAYETKVAPEITRVDPRVTQPKNYRGEYDPNMGADQDPTKGRYQKSIQGASQFGLINEPQPIRAADANFDFRISTPEWVAATGQRFEMLDRNADGFLTLDELPQTPLQAGLEAPQDVKGKGKPKKKFFGQ